MTSAWWPRHAPPDTALAFTTETGHHVSGSDPLRIRRFNMHEATVNTKPLFLSRLLGVL